QGISAFFSAANKVEFEQKWFEIQYSDKNERYTKRIIYVQEIQTDDGGDDHQSHILLKSNCLLRAGEIRHFRVDRIKGYRKMPDEFVKTFVADGKPEVVIPE